MGPAPDQTEAFRLHYDQLREVMEGKKPEEKEVKEKEGKEKGATPNPPQSDRSKPVDYGKVAPILMQMLQIVVSGHVK
jgi:hypothetical protein